MLQEISLDEIVSNRYQPRLRFCDADILELADSIKEVGLLHPPVLTPIHGTKRYEIIAGERRVLACRHLGLKAIPCVVKHSQTLEAIASSALIENVQRVDLNAVEVARSVKILMEDFGLNQEEIAQRLGKKRSTIANYLRILQLPSEMQEAIREGQITLAHAKVLLSLSAEKRPSLFKKMLKSDLSVEKATKLAKAKRDPCVHVKGLQERLSRHFGTKVELNCNNSKGSISLQFYNLEDLDRILQLIGLEE